MISLNFMFFCSLIEELCTKEEIYKTSCNFNFGHECILLTWFYIPVYGGYSRYLFGTTELIEIVRLYF